MRSLVLVLALPVVACSSSKKAVTADAPEAVDAFVCPGQPSYSGALANQSGLMRCTEATGFFGDCPGTMSGTTLSPDLVIAGGDYNDQDTLEIDLYKGIVNGQTFFPDFHAVSDIVLGGLQSDFAKCDACVIMDVGFAAGKGFSDQYIATSGTMNITAISGAATVSDAGHVAGNISNVTLAHVLIDTTNNTSMILDDGCTMTIGSASFDEPVDTMEANFAPGTRRTAHVRARIDR